MSNLLFWFIDFVFQFFSKLTAFIFKPLFEILVDLHLLNYNYLDSAQYFLNTYFYRYIKFARDVIINITGIPQQIFLLLGTLLFVSFSLFIASLSIKFIFNLWSIFRTGSAMYSSYEGYSKLKKGRK